MQVKVSMVENEIREALAVYLFEKYGIRVKGDALKVEVKSKQNYKSEWEEAAIRVEAEAGAQTKEAY